MGAADDLSRISTGRVNYFYLARGSRCGQGHDCAGQVLENCVNATPISVVCGDIGCGPAVFARLSGTLATGSAPGLEANHPSSYGL
jgi:hypothetical protein